MPSFIADVEEIRRRAAEKIEEGPITETYKGAVDKTAVKQILCKARV